MVQPLPQPVPLSHSAHSGFCPWHFSPTTKTLNDHLDMFKTACTSLVRNSTTGVVGSKVWASSGSAKHILGRCLNSQAQLYTSSRLSASSTRINSISTIRRHFHSQKTLFSKVWAHNKGSGRYKSSYRPLLLASATAIATLAPADEEQSNIHTLIPVNGSETREEGLIRASQQELANSARGTAKTNSSMISSWYNSIVHNFYLYFYNPVATCLRFIQLAALFGPVLISFPVVMLGPRITSGMYRFDGLVSDDSSPASKERTGAIMWYKYLTWTMEMAGPSFIKVMHDEKYYCFTWLQYLLGYVGVSWYYRDFLDD